MVVGEPRVATYIHHNKAKVSVYGIIYKRLDEYLVLVKSFRILSSFPEPLDLSS